uniref:Apolipoprotein L3-like n=1 Tax=Heterorhabditis bacteriophora TaxID=37862 RepID=A0A1I7XB96_HETBA
MEEEDVTGSSDTEKFDLYDINMLNEWHKLCGISTTVGSSTSLVGGVAVIGGLMFISPIAVAVPSHLSIIKRKVLGAVIGAVASTSNIATNIAKYIHIKRMIKEVSRLIESDEELLIKFLGSYSEWQEYVEKLENHKGQPIETSHKPSYKVKIPLGRVAATSTTAILTRLVLKDTTSASINILKGVAHASAAIGIAMDIASLISDVKDLSSGAKSDLDSELRQAAEKLEIERMEILRTALIELE